MSTQTEKAVNLPQTKDAEAGSAVVGYVMVGVMLVMVAAMLAQLLFLAYTRVVVIDVANEAARYAARFDAIPATTSQRVNQMLSVAAPAVRLNAVSAGETTGNNETSGHPLITVRVDVSMPVALRWLPLAPLHAQGRAVKEVIR